MSEGDFTKHVVVSDELVAELRAAPSRPVTLRIAELKGGQLEFVATEHRCAGERGSPPGDTPAPDGPWQIDPMPTTPPLWLVSKGAASRLLRDTHFFDSEAIAIVVRDALNQAARSAAAGSSAPPECESCHALRNQLQSVTAKLHMAERRASRPGGTE